MKEALLKQLNHSKELNTHFQSKMGEIK